MLAEGSVIPRVCLLRRSIPWPTRSKTQSLTATSADALPMATPYLAMMCLRLCACAVCVCVYIHARLLAVPGYNLHTHTYIHTRAYIHTHTHTRMHTHTYTHACIHTRTYTQRMHTHTHAYTHARACIHTHIHTHACMHTHAYIHTDSPGQPRQKMAAAHHHVGAVVDANRSVRWLLRWLRVCINMAVVNLYNYIDHFYWMITR